MKTLYGSDTKQKINKEKGTHRGRTQSQMGCKKIIMGANILGWMIAAASTVHPKYMSKNFSCHLEGRASSMVNKCFKSVIDE